MPSEMLPNGIVTSSSRDGKETSGARKNDAATCNFEQFTGSASVSPFYRFAAPSRERDRAAAAVVDQAQGGADAGSAGMSSVIAEKQSMKRFLEAAAKVISLSALVFSTAFGEELAPDALVRTIAEDVIAAIKQDAGLTKNPAKVSALVEAKVLPHFDFARTTRIAMGANWRRATPEQ